MRPGAFLLAAAAVPLSIAACCAAQEWQEIKGDHFIVRFVPSSVKPAGSAYPGDMSRFAADVLASAERHYRRIAADLGYTRSEFWTWDKRVSIVIYPDPGSYAASTGRPSWSQGMSDYAKKEISSYAFSTILMEQILAHEMTHLILRDFLGKGELPRWLDEGVAQWEEEPRRLESRQIMRNCLERDLLLSIEEMNQININVVDKFFAGLPDRTWLAKAGKELMAIYYAEAVSMIGFLIDTFGPDEFIGFCRQLRDGKPLEKAIVLAYPKQFKSLKDFEDQWKKSLGKN